MRLSYTAPHPYKYIIRQIYVCKIGVLRVRTTACNLPPGDKTVATGNIHLKTGFNPRPRAGGDKKTIDGRGFKSVSIHAPTRGATCLQCKVAPLRCFNPRPHAGGDGNQVFAGYITAVSIHAPTRGATIKSNAKGIIDVVSIHAPTRGATIARIGDRNTFLSFNPRPHAGGDACTADVVNPTTCFNPRPHAGGDNPAISKLYPDKNRFQSTPPRGGRLGAYTASICHAHVSIHAPTRGATEKWKQK